MIADTFGREELSMSVSLLQCKVRVFEELENRRFRMVCAKK